MDKEAISNICIDDFALKKRQRYGTVMVDMDTHKVVDMIESREFDDVVRWLAEYPNLRIVSRDGSVTYAAAITAAHPAAMQVSDRFHILKNLNERATQAFQKLFQGRIAIPLTAPTQRTRYDMLISTASQRIRKVKELHKEGRSKGEIMLLTGMSAPTVKKYIGMHEEDIPADKQTVRGREHDEALKKLLNRAARVRDLRESGMSVTEITQKTGFTATVVNRYLSADFTGVNAHYGKQREGKLEPFRGEVMKLREDGLKYREIQDIIKQKGYSGTQDAIRGFVSKECRIQLDLQTAAGGEPVELIDKKWIIRLLYKPLEQVRGISPSQLAAIFEVYPLSERIFDTVNEFKALVKAKDTDALLRWITKAETLKCPEIGAFINGLKQDIDAVYNAIATDFNNGLVEGTVNKIKVIKRVMYGRCCFMLLRAKTIALSKAYT